MCGIFAYAGSENAVPFLIDGLRSVEYRGYDSAGISVVGSNRSIKTIKCGDHKESLQNLITTVDNVGLSGSVGIGHTRWATHGEVNHKNSHPHSSSTGIVSIVHNGIIENFIELKDQLINSGVQFKSDTDSEVLAHLVGDSVSNGTNLREALVTAASRIKGNTAVVAISADEPDVIVGLRIGNAGGIVVGRNEKASVLASDAIALLPHTSEVVYLQPGEVVEISQGKITLSTIEGSQVHRDPVTTDMDFEAGHKGNHPHFMAKEIAEQSAVVQAAMRGRTDFAAETVSLPEFEMTMDDIKKINRVILTGMGTSLNACIFGAYLIETLSRIPATAENSSELRYRNPSIDSRTLVIAVTQSGETADTLAAMEHARTLGAPQAVVLEHEGSEATRIADFSLPIRAGQEVGVASTKTLIASMTTLLQLAVVLAEARGSISRSTMKIIIGGLSELPSMIGRTINLSGSLDTLSSRLSVFGDLLYLGRGSQLAIALEGALKMKELAYIHAEGYPAGEMKHGVNALLGPDMATVVTVPKNNLYEKLLSNISEVKARGGEVVAIATEGDTTIERVADHVIFVPQCSELFQPFVTLIPMQLLAYQTAVALGRDPDRPRNLAKTVTVE